MFNKIVNKEDVLTLTYLYAHAHTKNVKRPVIHVSEFEN